MRYAICNKVRAIANGYQPNVHRNKGNAMLLNEKEVMQNPRLSEGTFEERITTMAGRMLTEEEMEQTIKQGGWI